jgi:hypothetical protein
MRNFKKEEILILKRYVKPDFDVVLTCCRPRLHKPVQVRYDPKKAVWFPSKILFLTKMFFGTLGDKGITSVAGTGASQMQLLALPRGLNSTSMMFSSREV